MTLFEKQQLFPQLLGRLFYRAEELGYTLTLGEAYRPPDVAALYADEKRGIKNSLHTDRLAIDINLFRNEIYLTHTEDYRELGEFWKTLSSDGYTCTWGGDFNDANHFSISNQGKS